MDSIENLCVRIRLRKKAAGISLLNEKNLNFSNEIVARWQDRVDTAIR
jgi:hypothetical protein